MPKGRVVHKCAWFGADVVPGEGLSVVLPFILSGAPRFLAANWDEGFVVAVPEKHAERFKKLAEDMGWRLYPLDPPPALPKLRFNDAIARVWPLFSITMSRGGVVAEVKRGKHVQRVVDAIDRPYVRSRTLPSSVVVAARDSAARLNAVFRAFPFVFDDDGSEKLARRVAELKLPRGLGPLAPSGVGWFTPLDIEALLKPLAAGGGYGPASLRAFSVKLAPTLTLSFARSADNSLLLCGAPGTGKSATLDTILASAPKSWNVIVLDPTGEHAILEKWGYTVLQAGIEIFINPLELGPAHAFSVLLGFIEGFWGERATPIVAHTLRTALQGAATLADVYDRVAETLQRSSREDERTAAVALIRRLEPLLTCPALYGGKHLLPTGRVVVDMSAIETPDARAAFMITLLHIIYSAAQIGKWQGVVAIDEVDMLGNCEVVNWICDQLRKYSVSVWAAGHSLARIARKLADARYQLYFATMDPDTLKILYNYGALLQSLKFAQVLVRARGAPAYIASLHPHPEIWDAKARFTPGFPLPVTATAAKYNLSPRALAQAYAENRDIAQAIIAVASGNARYADALRGRGLAPAAIKALAELYTLAAARRAEARSAEAKTLEIQQKAGEQEYKESGEIQLSE